jgi:polysaccharide export outer membrane protein
MRYATDDERSLYARDVRKGELPVTPRKAGLSKGINFAAGGALLILSQIFPLQGTPWSARAAQTASGPDSSQAVPISPRTETTQDYSKRLEELAREKLGGGQDYRIGPDDVLDVSVFEAPDMNRTVRVSAEGEILLPLLGNVRAAGLTPSQLASVLEGLLRSSYMKDPHVGIFLKEMQSHPVSVFGAVAKPGVYQIRGAKTLVETLSMAQGLAPDAGDKVIIERQASEPVPEGGTGTGALTATPGIATTQSPDAQTSDGTKPPGNRVLEIRLKELVNSADPRNNVLVYPGDVVKVTRADVVYVVGEVRKPGGFQLNTNENISVLQVLALAEGLTHTSAANHSRVIRTDQATGNRTEIAIDIRRILAGKAPDQLLQPKDIVFVPNSAGRAALYRGAEAAIGVGSGLLIYRTP